MEPKTQCTHPDNAIENKGGKWDVFIRKRDPYTNKVEFGVVCEGEFSLGCFLLASVICKQGRLATLRMVTMTTDVKAPPVSWLPLFSTVLLSWGDLSAVVLCTCRRIPFNGNGWVFPMPRLASDMILFRKYYFKVICIISWAVGIYSFARETSYMLFNLFANVGRNLIAKKGES